MAMTAAQEWRANWKVVLAGMLGGSLASVHIYSFGVMIQPLEQEFGWSRTHIASGLLVVSIAGVLLATLVGAAIDRFGPRRFGMLSGSRIAAPRFRTSIARAFWTKRC